MYLRNEIQQVPYWKLVLEVIYFLKYDLIKSEKTRNENRVKNLRSHKTGERFSSIGENFGILASCYLLSYLKKKLKLKI